MADDMKSAFEKAGYKAPKQPAAPTQQPSAGKFVLKKNYAAQAEEVIQALKSSMGRDFQSFTTSKIRNILAMVSEIYNDILADKSDVLDLDLQSRIEYLRVRLVYESGREPRVVKPFVDKAGLLDLLNSIGDSKKNFIDFARYMEALVAYHRFLGGRD
jgi:CRISPR-associated protein Csm2